MKKYKVCVYAICKNEEKFIEKWYNSIKEADYICVLDTGSTDNSIKKFKELGIKVKKKIINPWDDIPEEVTEETEKEIEENIDPNYIKEEK